MPGVMTAVFGAQLGDEGKGRIVDYLAEGCSVSARFNGGDNAGHTVEVNGERIAFHLLPATALRTPVVILGRGMVVNLDTLIKEAALARRYNPDVNIIVDGRAHVVLPSHMRRDAAEESERGDQMIGTTKRGIGPAQGDRTLRKGLQLMDMLSESCPKFTDPEDAAAVARWTATWVSDVPFAVSTVEDGISEMLAPQMGQKPSSILSAAHGALLDLWHGEYPYVTTTSCNLDQVGPGLGISPRDVDLCVGVAKAYVTRIGAGSFETRMPETKAHIIREKANEYGTTTGRPRAIGWLDLDAIQYANRVNRYNYLALTHLDVFDGLGDVLVQSGYVMHTFPGWDGVRGVRSWRDLPETAKRFIWYIEDKTGVNVELISTGPDRDDMVDRR